MFIFSHENFRTLIDFFKQTVFSAILDYAIFHYTLKNETYVGLIVHLKCIKKRDQSAFINIFLTYVRI